MALGLLILGFISLSGRVPFPLSFHLFSACKVVTLPTIYSTKFANSLGCFGLGFILDTKYLGQRRRAQVGLYMVIILNVGVYIWSIIMQTKFNRHNPGSIDWDDGLYASSFLPYFFVQTTGPLSQSYMYWLLSSFATDAQGAYSAIVRLKIIQKTRNLTAMTRKRPKRRRISRYRSCRPSCFLRHKFQITG